MNLQQLEYIIAVDRERHFARAAGKCFVTQATLSMMIKKLESELEVKIFDRSRQPVTPTTHGKEIIERAKKIVREASMLAEFTKDIKNEMSGEIRIGIIPTLAPYLLPLFLKSLSEKLPDLRISVNELITNEIIRRLKKGELDIGLLATPLNESSLTENHLFYEEFFAYASKTERLPGKKYLLPGNINPHHLWLLEEGHCMRSQLMNLCELKNREGGNVSLHYEAGSIETLINLVDRSDGITIIPQLAALNLSSSQRNKLREFAPPKPVREISLVVSRNFPRIKLLDHIKSEIVRSVRKNLPTKGKGLKIIKIGPV